MNTFINRNILITGASSGLGRELSIYFDQKVKSLICAGRHNFKVKSLKERLKNKKNIYFSGDLSNEKKLKKFLIFLNKDRNIDTVIHCMGGGFGIKADLVSKKEFLKLMLPKVLMLSFFYHGKNMVRLVLKVQY